MASFLYMRGTSLQERSTLSCIEKESFSCFSRISSVGPPHARVYVGPSPLIEGCVLLWRVIDKTTVSLDIFIPKEPVVPMVALTGTPTTQESEKAEPLCDGEHCKITPSARRALYTCLGNGSVKFVKDIAGRAFALLLVNTFKGKITSFEVTSEGIPIINGLLPELGGLPPLASKLWNIAMKCPDYATNLAGNLPVSLLSSEVTYASLDPSSKAIVDEMLNFQQVDGKPTLYIPASRQALYSLAGKQPNEKGSGGLVEALYGEGLEYVGFEEHSSTQKEDKIKLISRTKSATCPCCGETTKKRPRGGPRHKPRIIHDYPITMCVPAVIEIQKVKKYKCMNPKCLRYKKGFVESFAFVKPKKRMTDRLISLIIALAILTSFHGEENILNLAGITVSDSTIRRLILDLEFPDDSDVSQIGVDDTAYRKGMTYLTVIYELKTHRLLDIVDGRDGTELKKWLDKHPKVTLICRDRGTAYSKTIDDWAKEKGCTVEEIADRFHLVQNCIDHIKKHCSTLIPSRVAIIVNGNDVTVTTKDIPNKVATAECAVPTQEQMNEFLKKYDNAPTDKDGSPIELDLTLATNIDQEEELQEGDASEMAAASSAEGSPPPEEETTNPPHTIGGTSSLEQDKRDELYNLICSIRAEIQPNKPRIPQYKALAEKYNLPAKTVGQYARMTESELRDLKGTPLTPEEKEAELLAQQQKREEDYALACAIHAEFKPKEARKPQYAALAETYKIDTALARSYCLMSEEEIEAIRNPLLAPAPKPKKPRKQKKKKIDDFKYIIYKMLVDNLDISATFWLVKKKGCTLADEPLIKAIVQIYGIIYPNKQLPAVKNYITLSYPEGVYVFSRCALLKYITTINPKTKKNPILERYASLIYSKFPTIVEVKTTFTDFHAAIMGENPDAVEAFITKYSKGYLSGFCKSLNRDLEAIHNAVKYIYSSGFVEGGNSKIKCLKRISYGRLRLPTLRIKCMFAFMCKSDDFQLTDVAPWLSSA